MKNYQQHNEAQVFSGVTFCHFAGGEISMHGFHSSFEIYLFKKNILCNWYKNREKIVLDMCALLLTGAASAGRRVRVFLTGSFH